MPFSVWRVNLPLLQNERKIRWGYPYNGFKMEKAVFAVNGMISKNCVICFFKRKNIADKTGNASLFEKKSLHLAFPMVL